MLKMFQRYKDEKLAERALQALDSSPAIHINNMDVISKNGVVTLSGTLQKGASRLRAVEVVQSALNVAGLKYQKIVDELADKK